MRNRNTRDNSTFFCLLWLVLMHGVCFAIPSPKSIQQIARETMPSVATLTIRGENGVILKAGSGFVVRDNLLVTNYHVVTGAKSITANFPNGFSVPVYGIENVDPDHDLAVLFLNTSHIKPLPLGDSRKVSVGDSVIAVGNPKNVGVSISTGIISGFRQTGDYLPIKLIQTTAAISSGSSGGALVNDQGQVIGITALIMNDSENLNFAYPSSYLVPLIPSYPKLCIQWFDKAATPLYRNWMAQGMKYTDAKHYNRRSYALGEFYLRAACSIKPDIVLPHGYLGCCLLGLGQKKEARQQFYKAMTLTHDKEILAMLRELVYRCSPDYIDPFPGDRLSP